MARLSCGKRAELKSFWRSHHEEWECSTLNQWEYCEAHGLPLKRFGNWRAKFKSETAADQDKLLCPSPQGSQTIAMFFKFKDGEVSSTVTHFDLGAGFS